jgi:hypothetical protein
MPVTKVMQWRIKTHPGKSCAPQGSWSDRINEVARICILAESGIAQKR